VLVQPQCCCQQVWANLLRALEQLAEQLEGKSLVDKVASVVEDIEVAKQRMKILKELSEAYRNYLANASSTVAMAEFRSILNGATGCNSVMLRELRLPACMLEDLLGLQAVELLDVGDLASMQKLHQLLTEKALVAVLPTEAKSAASSMSSMSSMSSTCEDPSFAKLQRFIYSRLATRILRAKQATVESTREQLHALLGPLVGMSSPLEEDLPTALGLALPCWLPDMGTTHQQTRQQNIANQPWASGPGLRPWQVAGGDRRWPSWI
jgi:hypothetical protein